MLSRVSIPEQESWPAELAGGPPQLNQALGQTCDQRPCGAGRVWEGARGSLEHAQYTASARHTVVTLTKCAYG